MGIIMRNGIMYGGGSDSGNAGGDIYACIIANYMPDGICKATNGTLVLTAKETNGFVMFGIPEPTETPETWTLTLLYNGNSTTRTVVVTAKDVYTVNLYPGLKPGYERIPYLGVDAAGPYINTGIKNAPGAYFEVDCQYTEAPGSNSGIFGSSHSGLEFVINAWGGGYVCAGLSKYTMPDATSRHKYRAGSDYIYVDDSPTSIHTAWGSSTNNDYLIFAFSYPNTIYKGNHIRIYLVRIWDYDEVVRDMVPARRTLDGALGMYDMAHDIFYGNDGSGEFVTEIQTD